MAPLTLELSPAVSFRNDFLQAASGLKDLTGSTSREVLMNRWRNPSLSILGIESGAVGWSTIPKGCSARVRMLFQVFDAFLPRGASSIVFWRMGSFEKGT
jgi:hypothetical protein